MPNPLTRADLDGTPCQAEGCDHAHDAEGLVLSPRCHPHGRTEVWYRAGVLTLVCGRCKKMIVEIAVAPDPLDATGFDLSRLNAVRRRPPS